MTRSTRVTRSSPNEVLAIAQRAHAQLAEASGAVAYPFVWRWERSRYATAWLCSRPSEATVQAQILAHLARRGVRAFAVDAGSKALRGRAMGALRRAGQAELGRAVAAMKRANDTDTGVSDLVGTLPGGRSLYVEVKRPEWLQWHPERGAATQVGGAGTPSPEQLRFLADMHAQGALVGICWSVEDADRLLTSAGVPT